MFDVRASHACELKRLARPRAGRDWEWRGEEWILAHGGEGGYSSPVSTNGD